MDEIICTAQFSLDQWIDAQSEIPRPSVRGNYSMDGQEHWTEPDENKIHG